MNNIPFRAQAQAIADIRFAPIARLVGVGFIGNAIGGSLGTGIALLLPMVFVIIGAIIDEWLLI